MVLRICRVILATSCDRSVRWSSSNKDLRSCSSLLCLCSSSLTPDDFTVDGESARGVIDGLRVDVVEYSLCGALGGSLRGLRFCPAFCGLIAGAECLRAVAEGRLGGTVASLAPSAASSGTCSSLLSPAVSIFTLGFEGFLDCCDGLRYCASLEDPSGSTEVVDEAFRGGCDGLRLCDGAGDSLGALEEGFALDSVADVAPGVEAFRARDEGFFWSAGAAGFWALGFDAC